ncbi:protein ABHD11-like isoform X1 [Homalodisca vitripennis]|uniref:protein ABHD11-like isoform X1 n=1 Tax=Homalodisca vitripennis TaxID=197043 RepID=UPI001EEC8408|nr:protein ABHD11-like isoform X1 [Homalodisca vitripennis]
MFALQKIISLGSGFVKTNIHNVFILSAVNSPETIAKRNTWTSKPPVQLQLSYQHFAEPTVSANTIPIIVLHGLLGSKTNWNSVCKALAKENFRTVIAVDARNHGESPHIDDFSYEAMVCDVVCLLKELNFEKASFIGHSMGGRTVMLLAQMHPELVHSMAIVDISPVGQSPNMTGLSKLLKQIKNLDLNHDLTLSEARKQAAEKLSKLKLESMLVNFILTNLADNKPISNWRWKFNIQAIEEHFQTEICRFPILHTDVQTRTLFISGMNSDYVRPEDEPRIKKIFPKANFKYITGAGHWVHADKPQAFIQTVSEFFREEKHHYS